MMTISSYWRGWAVLALASVALALLPVIASAGVTTLVSVHSDGTQGDGASIDSAISADSGVVAFSSYATNLVGGDDNGVYDVFVHDRDTGATTRVSVRSDGNQGDDDSYEPAVSADGRFVAFHSWATNLVDGDDNGDQDVFVHDRDTGTTTRVSVHSDGSQGDGHSHYPAISADGRVVAFDSTATNLVDGDDNGKIDVFVHDCDTGTTIRVSIHSDGTPGNGQSYHPSISADGRVVAFVSEATNLVDGDDNYDEDVFVHDRDTGTTTRVSVRSDGSQGDDDSRAPAVSADGRFVAFASGAANLVDGDDNGVFDIFVHDRDTGATTRVSVHSDGTQADRGSGYPAISADGRVVAFWSAATNLVDGTITANRISLSATATPAPPPA